MTMTSTTDPESAETRNVPIGTDFGRYRLLESLGAGGVGEVFRAEDVALGRTVALKVLHRSRPSGRPGLTRAGAARILREARAAATIDHPNAVLVFDTDEHAGVPYMVMELVPGRNLRAFVGDPVVGIATKVEWLIAIARALSAAHRRGIIHQDIKPENVMLRDDGVIKVLDFGIARRVSDEDGPPPSAHGSAGVYGTPAYMAPERLSGEEGDALSDQFAWGVVAYELLAADYPWETRRGLVELARDTVAREPDPPSRRCPDVPRAIDDVVLKALSRRPMDRFASMDDVVVALSPARVQAASPPTAATVVRRPRRRVVAAVAVAMALIAGAATPRDARVSPMVSPPPPTVGRPDFGSTMSANPAAVAEYTAGIDALWNAARSTARKHFDQAIKLDPSFAAAHLRRVLSASEVTDVERENVRRATQFRDGLGEHDRGLLQATAPWVTVPQDIPEVERRVAAFTTTHRDADNLYHLCRFRMLAGNYLAAIEACRAAHELDGSFASVYWLEGQSRLYLNDVQAGIADLEACLRVSPMAVACINDLMQLRSNEGACDAGLRDAQRLVSLEPDNGLWLEQLGSLSYANGKPLAEARAAFEQWLDLSPPSRIPILRVRTRTYLAVLAGDFDEARVQLDALERAVDGSGDELLNVDELRIRTRYLQEIGQERKGTGRARAFLARHAAWSPSPVIHGSIVAWIALYRGGGISRREMLAAREEWYSHQEAQPLVPGRYANTPGRRWIWGYANAAVTTEDARDALAALPRYLPLPPDRFRDTEDDEAIGRIYLMAGRPEEALSFLRRATRSCKAALYPFEHTWANLELGEALESTDVAGACAAYQVVLDRWGMAAASRSARLARARWKELGCP